MKKTLGIMMAICMVAMLSVSAFAASEVEDSATNVSASQLMEDQQAVQRRGPYKGMVTQNGVNVRSGPGTSYASLWIHEQGRHGVDL